MFRLSQKADYGLLLLSTLCRSASKGKPMSISVIAKEHKISEKFLALVAGELKKAGLLVSKEGISGGYALARDPSKIKLIDVLKVLEGGLVEGKCFEENHVCKCGAKDMWKEMQKQMEVTIGRKTVADLKN